MSHEITVDKKVQGMKKSFVMHSFFEVNEKYKKRDFPPHTCVMNFFVVVALPFSILDMKRERERQNVWYDDTLLSLILLLLHAEVVKQIFI